MWKRIPALLALASLFSILLALVVHPAYADEPGPVTIPAMVDAGTPPTIDAAADTGSGSAVTPAPAPSSVTPDSSDAELAQSLWHAIQSKDWFLAVGAAMALVVHLLRWLLKKKWPAFEKDRWGWCLAAGVSGVVAVSAAWLAGKDAATTHTIVGALKIFAAATTTYVSTKKLAA